MARTKSTHERAQALARQRDARRAMLVASPPLAPSVTAATTSSRSPLDAETLNLQSTSSNAGLHIVKDSAAQSAGAKSSSDNKKKSEMANKPEDDTNNTSAEPKAEKVIANDNAVNE